MGGNHTSGTHSTPEDRGNEQQPLIDPATTMETAANDIYEALVEDEEVDMNEDAVWLREQRTLNKATHWLRRPSALMISVFTFGVAFAFSSAEATRNMITFKLACNFLAWKSQASVCDPSETQVLVSNLQLAIMISAGVFSLIALGKMGPLSDQYGRKPFFMVIIGGILVARLGRYYLMYHYDTLQFVPIVLAEVCGNLFGGIVTLITLTNCYISDVAEPHERIYSLGLGMAGLFVGLSLGPVVGNLILSLSSAAKATAASMSPSKFSRIDHGEYRPLQFEIVVLLVILVMFMLVVPESRSERARGKSRSLHRSQSTALLQSDLQTSAAPATRTWLQVLNPNFLKPLRLLALPEDAITNAARRNLPRERVVVATLVCVDCFLMCLAQPMGQVYVLYGIYSFDWSSYEIGEMLAVSCSARAITLLVISPILTHKVFHKWMGFTMMKHRYDLIDFSMCALGVAVEATAFLLVYAAPSTTMFLAASIFNSLSSFASPALNSSIIKFYPESKIGEVFGALALVKNLFTILSPIGILSIYKLSVSKWHNAGIIFLVLSALTFLCFLAVIVTKQLSNLTRDSQPMSRSNSSVSEERTPLVARNSYTDLHRTNSFVREQRNGDRL